MRFVIKDLNDIPPTLSHTNTLEDLEKIALGNLALIKPAIYKGEYKDTKGKIKSEVREYLNKYYLEKCGYCERYCKAEIEHYRPKKGVTGIQHKGYYWLCYEWSNLIPSCRYCNTEGGKGNQFPIIDNPNRVNNPVITNTKLDKSKSFPKAAPLKDEQPYLLHPEIDNPKKFFVFEIEATKKGVSIKGKTSNDRGNNTVSICNLNRNELLLERMQVYFEIRQSIIQVFDFLALGLMRMEDIGVALKSVFGNLESNLKNEALSHTLLRWFILDSVDNFSNHFSPYIENDSQRLIVVEAFGLYKSGSL